VQERNRAALGRVRLFGQAQSNEAYQIRDLLTRSVVAFDWIELGSDEDCRRELGLALTDARLPVVELPDGSTMSAPSLRELADRLG
jgi:thioredoxin reductase (NADPH)